MDFAPELALLYAELGEPVLVAGSPVTAIFDGGFVEALGMAATAPSLRCRTADVELVAPGAAVVRLGVIYLVRVVEPIAPDELERRLILERQ